jgi:hypothetical protein
MQLPFYHQIYINGKESAISNAGEREVGDPSVATCKWERRKLATFPLALRRSTSSRDIGGAWSTKQGVECVFSDAIATALATMRKSNGV